jgi:DNA (cytosine-5)-methyltransferase 1
MGGGQREPCVIQPIALAENTIGRQPENGGNGDGFTDGGPMYTLNATGVHGVAQPISFDMAQITSKANGTRVESGLPVSTLAKGSQMHVAQPIAFTTEQTPKFSNESAFTLTKQSPTGGGQPQCVMQPKPFGISEQPNVGHCLRASASMADKHESTTYVAQQMAVRRLTPKECERLQGFPDNYTDIKPKGKPTPDGSRYKALGNSMAVPVMAWIGKRIQEVENIKCKPNK